MSRFFPIYLGSGSAFDTAFTVDFLDLIQGLPSELFGIGIPAFAFDETDQFLTGFNEFGVMRVVSLFQRIKPPPEGLFLLLVYGHSEFTFKIITKGG